jgi:hypothetical protein
MSSSVQVHLSDDEVAAYEAMGYLEGLGYEIIFGPEKVDGAIKDGTVNTPYFDRWTVIGKK